MQITRRLRARLVLISVTAIGSASLLASCGSSAPSASQTPTQDSTAAPVMVGPAAYLAAPSTTDTAAFKVGPAAGDTVGGWLPEEVRLSPFDESNPMVIWLDPALVKAVQDAARSAAAEGIDVKITSGWRSKGFQQRLLDNGIRTYGSLEKARDFVALPTTSMHVEGKAVDIGPPDVAAWMIRNGPRFGLCQVYANEPWHFELAVDEHGNCRPLKPNANS